MFTKLAVSPFSPAEWLGLPENGSAHGDDIGHMIDVIHWFMIALFVGWTIFFFLCLFKFWHKKNPQASYTGVKNHASTHLEIGVVIIEAVLLLGFALPLWSERTDDFDQAKKENAIRVRAVGFQFGWKYHYAGADGKFGFIDRTLAKSQGDHCLDPAEMETSVVCGQLCGEGHARMVGALKVIPQKEFNDFLKKQSANAFAKNQKK